MEISHALTVLTPALGATGVLVAANVARRNRRFASATVAAASLIAFASLKPIVLAYASNVHRLREWDYLCFWLYGQGLAHRYDPYAAKSLAAIALPIPVEAAFRREIVDVGIPYPPWSLVVLRPLGFVTNPYHGALVWCAIELVALLGAVIVLSRWRTTSWHELPVVAALVFLLPPSVATAGLAQTIPLTLLFLALYVVRNDRLDAGFWLAAAIVVKPFLVMLLIVPLLRRDFRHFGIALATLVASTAIGAILSGPSVIASYTSENPIARIPGSVLSESNNVSITAYALRAAHIVPINGATLPTSFVWLEVVLTLLGVAAAVTVSRRDGSLTFCSLLTLALLVYPQSNVHYAVLLALPLLALRQHAVFESRPLVFVTITFVVYVLLSISGGAYTILATLLLWTVCLITSLRAERRRDPSVRHPTDYSAMRVAPAVRNV